MLLIHQRAESCTAVTSSAAGFSTAVMTDCFLRPFDNEPPVDEATHQDRP